MPIIDVAVLLPDPRIPYGERTDEGSAAYSARASKRNKLFKKHLNQLSGYRFSFHDDHLKMLQELDHMKPTLVFNLCDTGFLNNPNREMHLISHLELNNIRYTGCSAACLSACNDKLIVTSLARSIDVPTPREVVQNSKESRALTRQMLPVVVKFLTGHGSEGMDHNSVACTPQQLDMKLEELEKNYPHRKVVAQEFLPGEEYTAFIIGNSGDIQHLPIMVVSFTNLPDNLPRIYTYAAKFVEGSTYWENTGYEPAEISKTLTLELNEYAGLLFNRLGCSDYARIDFRADAQGQVRLLEVNPNPDLTYSQHLEKMAHAAGLSYLDILDMVLRSACVRYKLR